MNAENQITIDGRPFAFSPGETILDIAKRNDIFIPTLCHLPGAQPTGACRMCVVEVERARSLMAACTVPATPNMVVHTNTPAVLAARRTILGLLLASGYHNCSVRTEAPAEWTALQSAAEAYDGSDELCEVYGACKLQALSYRYQVDSGAFAPRKPEYALESASPLILRDFSRCILCGRCVQACNEVQVNNALSHGFRGVKSKIVAMGNDSLRRSDCVFCGECIQACPVGALVETKSRYQIRPWQATHVRTTCGYCSVGCQLDLHVSKGRIRKVTGIDGALPNHGRLCAKGRFGFDFLRSPHRLTTPMIRRNGELAKASWDEALDVIAAKIKEIREQHGAESIAGICSASATNETLYVFQKLFRAGVGTNNITAPFAATPMSNSLEELESAGCILLIGSDVTQENPVAGTFIKRAVARGAKLIVIDAPETRISGFASVHLKAAEGTEAVLVNGMIRLLLDAGPPKGVTDPKRLDALKETAQKFTLGKVTETTGVDPAAVEEAVQTLRAAESTMLVSGPKVSAWLPVLTALQEVLGNLEGQSGGINPLGDLSNSAGAVLMGVHPQYLPGYADVGDAAARGRFEAVWGGTLAAKPGLALPQMVAGSVRMLFCAGENLALAEPGLEGAQAALESADFVVVQDILENESLRHADVVLPAAAWAEEDGTFTNCERRVSRARQAVDPPGEARPGTWIYTELARRLGHRWPEPNGRALWEQEIAGLVPQVGGITYARIESDGLQWPVADATGPGSPQLGGVRPPLLRPEWNSFNYHHRGLLEQCDGLLEALALARKPGAPVAANDPEEIARQLEAFLREEEIPEKKAELDELLASHRPMRGSLILVLQKVQGSIGFLPVPVQNYIALGLGLPASDVFGVVSFYSFFTMVPRGKHVIRVCLGTACYVKGSGKILEKIELHLGIKVGETTPDREYSLEAVRCVGACGLAPVAVVDETTHGMVDPAEAPQIVESYRSTSDDT